MWVTLSVIMGACGNHFILQKRHYRKGFYFVHHGKQNATRNGIEVKKEFDNNSERSYAKAIITNEKSDTINEEIRYSSCPVKSNNNPSFVIKKARNGFHPKEEALKKEEFYSHKNAALPMHKNKIRNNAAKKDGVTILLDIILIFLGLFGASFFIFLAFLAALGSSSSGSGGNPNLAYVCIVLAIICVGAPFKKLINDL